MKRKLSILLVAALCISFCLPAQAAVFSDIDSETVNIAVGVLKGMGVVDGYGDGKYHGEESLTRGQLCKMIVVLAGKEDEVSTYARRTMFNDVKGSHWAAGYINLAYSLGYISGYGDGTFGPDDTITYAQAVTIAIQMLGYTASDVGQFWPSDYVSFADTIGLSKNLNLDTNAALNRADAAILLLNLLQQDTKNGTAYAATIRTRSVSDAFLISNNAASSTASSQVLVSVNGNSEYYEQANDLPDEILGMRGTLLLNSSGAVVGFVPDDRTYETIAVSSVSANSITSSTGKKYSVASGAGVIVYGDYKTWELGFADVYAGCTARIFYSDSGTVELVYVSSASTSSTVYIAKRSVSKADNPFETAFNLTQGQYNIVKNGAVSTVDDLAQYDVATFDAATNTLRVSDYRVTGTWQTSYPSASAPTKVTVMGHEFPVLESARDSFAKLKTGAQITLLLTSDLQVAAAYPATNVKASQQIGIVQSVQDETATVTLTNGVSVSGKLVSSTSEASRMIGALVAVSSSGTGLYLTGLDYDGTRSTWNVSSRTLGSTLLSPYVQIYERVNGGAARKISESSVLVSSVSATDIEYVSYNAQGKVSMMVVSDVTGDAYTYGMAKTGEQTVSSENLSGTNQTISVVNADGQSESLVTSKKFTSGSFIGIASSTNGKLAGYAALTKAGGISRDAFTGEDYVKVGKNQLPIADDVQVYNTATATWTSLAVAKAYAETFTVYYDKTPSTGGKIRVITY